MASRTARGARYSRQIVIMVTPEVGEHLDATAQREEVSMSEITRGWLDSGIALDAISTEYGVPLDRLLQLAVLAAIGQTMPDAPTVETLDAETLPERPATAFVEVPLG